MAKEKELIIKPTDKELLPESNSISIDGVLPKKRIVAGRKLNITKAAAILTTTPVDTVNEVVNLASQVAPLVIMLVKERIEQKKKNNGDKHPPGTNIYVSGDNNNIQIQTNNCIKCQVHKTKRVKKK